MVRPHPLAYEFLGTFGDLGRQSESSLSLVECRAWLDERRVADPGRRDAYIALWRALDGSIAADHHEELRKIRERR